MSPEKEKELIDIYPDLFDEKFFCFECHDGWFELLKKLITQIKQFCESPQFENPLTIDDKPLELKVTQIKEKYGTLRFYTNYFNSFIETVVEEACHSSKTTCEVCGNPGTLTRKNFYWSVRCKDCETT
jgi:hypothetical protein